MKKEIEAIVNDEFLGSILDAFYVIHFSTGEVMLQGYYKNRLAKAISDQYEKTWAVKRNGFLEMQILKMKEQEDGEQKDKEIIINFILT